MNLRKLCLTVALDNQGGLTALYVGLDAVAAREALALAPENTVEACVYRRMTPWKRRKSKDAHLQIEELEETRSLDPLDPEEENEQLPPTDPNEIRNDEGDVVTRIEEDEAEAPIAHTEAAPVDAAPPAEAEAPIAAAPKPKAAGRARRK